MITYKELHEQYLTEMVSYISEDSEDSIGPANGKRVKEAAKKIKKLADKTLNKLTDPKKKTYKTLLAVYEKADEIIGKSASEVTEQDSGWVYYTLGNMFAHG
jgi:hypothetical protein